MIQSRDDNDAEHSSPDFDSSRGPYMNELLDKSTSSADYYTGIDLAKSYLRIHISMLVCPAELCTALLDTAIDTESAFSRNNGHMKALS